MSTTTVLVTGRTQLVDVSAVDGTVTFYRSTLPDGRSVVVGESVSIHSPANSREAESYPRSAFVSIDGGVTFRWSYIDTRARYVAADRTDVWIKPQPQFRPYPLSAGSLATINDQPAEVITSPKTITVVDDPVEYTVEAPVRALGIGVRIATAQATVGKGFALLVDSGEGWGLHPTLGNSLAPRLPRIIKSTEKRYVTDVGTLGVRDDGTARWLTSDRRWVNCVPTYATIVNDPGSGLLTTVADARGASVEPS